jgi:uncharacterized protein YecT (DUF1311 family)
MNAALMAAAVVVAAAAGAAGGYAAHPGTAPAARTPSPTATAAASPTSTATPSPTPTPSRLACWDTAQTQVALNDCAAADMRAAEHTLTAVLATVRAAAGTRQRAALDRAHREWLAYRDTICASNADGGTIDGLDVASCRATLATDHAREICTWWSPNSAEDQPAECPKQ